MKRQEQRKEEEEREEDVKRKERRDGVLQDWCRAEGGGAERVSRGGETEMEKVLGSRTVTGRGLACHRKKCK